MSEKLVDEGTSQILFSTPLSGWFPRDSDPPQYLRYRVAQNLIQTSTACWRGYVGTWEIRNEELFLTKLESNYKQDEFPEVLGQKVDFADFLPKASQLPLKATWFTGTLRVPMGEMIQYVHMGFGSIYEQTKFIEVKKGRITSRRVVNNALNIRTRSAADLQWVSMADSPADDRHLWKDARILMDPLRGIPSGSCLSFATRGIYIAKSDWKGRHYPSCLTIPETPTTQPVMIEIAMPPSIESHANGDHVEIICRISPDPGPPVLIVSSMRGLEPGETMHHPSFQP